MTAATDGPRLPEVLAPAGSRESLDAALRTGADAVYLGGKTLNARRGASNFSDEELVRVTGDCHVRGVKVYLTLNTIVFGDELLALAGALETACAAGVDGIIVQDMGVLRLARRHAPDLPVHASTQMAVHNGDGAKALEELGVSRVVLARELTLEEIGRIKEETSLELEVFVHGALCMCVSGQCYLSSMIGGRSGNRGLCAQPCRLPFRSEGSEYALSLKDLSNLERVRELASLGVSALKIEGRLKRPEYVAAAVRACRQSLAGQRPDMEELRAVFSRSGFTDGYLADDRGDAMFGTRQREDVVSAGPVLKRLARLYDRERQSVPVDMELNIEYGLPVTLTVWDRDGHMVRVEGSMPEQALTRPTRPERARELLEKTGGTPYYAAGIDVRVQPGILTAAANVNSLRREALEALTALRGAARPWPMTAVELPPAPFREEGGAPSMRVRVERWEQLEGGWAREAELIIAPLAVLARAPAEELAPLAGKLAAELPRIRFGDGAGLSRDLARLRDTGVSRAVAGNIGGVRRARELGFLVHGDAFLNIANRAALEAWAELGLCDATLSFELSLERARRLCGSIPSGLIAYGRLPLMIFRNRPAGSAGGVLTDRKNTRFPLLEREEATELLNMVPLYVGDRLRDFSAFDFLTCYFTTESAKDCARIITAHRLGAAWTGTKTRGLYYREVQ